MKSICLITLSDFGLGRAKYLAKSLKAMGFDVVVVTNEPIYQNIQRSQESTDTFLDIIHIPIKPQLYRTITLRLLTYIYLSFAAFFAVLQSDRRFHIWYCRGPHPFMDLTVILLKWLKGGKVISDITDLWPDALAHVSMNPILKRIFILIGRVLNLGIYPKLDVLITLNELMARTIFETTRRTPHIIYGVIDTHEFRPMNKEKAIKLILSEELGSLVKEKFVVLYAGLLGPFQNIGSIIKLAEKMKDHEDLLFLVVGDGPLKVKLSEVKQSHALKNLILLNTFPHHLMPLVYNMGDVFLLPHGDFSYLKMGLPKKFIEYSACGKPIIYIGPSCITSDLCIQWQAGYHILPAEIDKAVESILLLKNNPQLRVALGQNARRMAESLFSIESCKKRLEEIISAEILPSSVANK